jgi:hypothetical protein
VYDKVNWTFLELVLKIKGFPSRWCQWIEKVVTNGSVCTVTFFSNKKGLRQSDPLSPILFNLGGQKNLGFFDVLVPHLVEDGLSILQYADDTILFLDEKAKSLKLVLSAFEKLSGLKINFHKTELLSFGETKDMTEEYVELFGRKEGEFSFRYLGIPMSAQRLSNKDRRVVEERFQKKLSSWKGKILSSGGRLVLINSVLSSLAMFMISFFRIHKGVPEKPDYYRSRFLLAMR